MASYLPHPIQKVTAETRRTLFTTTQRRAMWGLVLLGLAAVIAGFATDASRVWQNLLVAHSYLLGLALGGLLFVAIHYITKAGWGTVLRRVPEAMGATLPIAALITVPILVFGMGELYGWVQYGGDPTKGAESYHPMQPSKVFWLSPGFFVVRVVVYFLIWFVLTRALLRRSNLQDTDGNVAHTHANVRNSALFLVLFGLTFSLATFDMMMSIDYHWFSTMYGVYHFAGAFLTAIAMITLLTIGLHKAGALPGLRTDHLHNLGKLLFAFATFWAYIWFSQYMLIWYANLLETTPYYIKRSLPGWDVLFLLNLVCNWAIPFLVLLPRPAKRNVRVLVYMSLLILAAQWLDRYLMIMPEFSHAPQFGLIELGIAAGAIGAFLLVFDRAFGQAAPIPLRDPYLGESIAEPH